jgi:hypothetical protein
MLRRGPLEQNMNVLISEAQQGNRMMLWAVTRTGAMTLHQRQICVHSYMIVTQSDRDREIECEDIVKHCGNPLLDAGGY